MFKDLLYEIKGFKYQINVKLLLKKHKPNGEFAPVYFNSTIKTVISSNFNLDKSFQEVLDRIDYWTNGGPGWVIEPVDAEYVNTWICL